MYYNMYIHYTYINILYIMYMYTDFLEITLVTYN